MQRSFAVRALSSLAVPQRYRQPTREPLAIPIFDAGRGYAARAACRIALPRAERTHPSVTRTPVPPEILGRSGDAYARCALGPVVVLHNTHSAALETEALPFARYTRVEVGSSTVREELKSIACRLARFHDVKSAARFPPRSSRTQAVRSIPYRVVLRAQLVAADALRLPPGAVRGARRYSTDRRAPPPFVRPLQKGPRRDSAQDQPPP